MSETFTLCAATDLESPYAIAFDDAVTLLEQGRVEEEIGLMRYGSNYTFLVSVQYKDTKLLAIYKPRQGERPLWDFPDGTLCQREVATYVTAEALGWRNVPPTVLREGPRGIGSVQLFIDHDPQLHYFTFDEAVLPQIETLALLDSIVNNADRKGGHCLLDAKGRLWGSDHGMTFNTHHKLRTVIWDFSGKSIPEHLSKDLSKFCTILEDETHPAHCALNELLYPMEVKALKRRVERLIATQTFPRPGPGPNRPWPQV